MARSSLTRNNRHCSDVDCSRDFCSGNNNGNKRNQRDRDRDRESHSSTKLRGLGSTVNTALRNVARDEGDRNNPHSQQDALCNNVSNINIRRKDISHASSFDVTKSKVMAGRTENSRAAVLQQQPRSGRKHVDTYLSGKAVNSDVISAVIDDKANIC